MFRDHFSMYNIIYFHMSMKFGSDIIFMSNSVKGVPQSKVKDT